MGGRIESVWANTQMKSQSRSNLLFKEHNITFFSYNLRKDRESKPSSNRRLPSFFTAMTKRNEAFLYQTVQSWSHSLTLLLTSISTHNCELRIQISKLIVLSGFYKLLSPCPRSGFARASQPVVCCSALKNSAQLIYFLQLTSLSSLKAPDGLHLLVIFPASSSSRPNISFCYHSDIPAPKWTYNG